MLALNWDSPKNLIVGNVPLLPTIIQDPYGNILGLAYSSKESLEKAINEKIGVYYSRERGLWVKSPSRVNGQTLLEVKTDCDGDALIFTVVQHGVFCHTGTKSCFNNVIYSGLENKITIGYTYGRSENDILSLLGSVGIDIFKSTKPRDTEYRVFSHLHNNIQIIPCKPRDINRFLQQGIISVAVAYSDAIKDFKSLYPSSAKTVKIVAVVKKDDQRFDGQDYYSLPLTIFSEFKAHGRAFLQKFPNGKMVKVHGNTEQFVRNNQADIGIVVCDTGKTLKENGLRVLEVLEVSKLGVFFSEQTYRKYPRFFRELANNLTEDTIFFYSVDGPNGFMSNFYPCHFVDKDGIEWKSSEHYYQAHKFFDKNLFELIRSQPTAKMCYKTAYQWADKFRPDWLEVKDVFMMEALRYKFDQDPVLMTRLLNTGKKKLVEHALRDYHYGCGEDGTGKNRLGEMLMEIRDN